mmetsp:Transcript_30398/g.65765  ORF Transcript_30398/g.65765 Transcript_30398/m.65765 type:complete len:256 (-) Transcript_30398:62-829(-)
MEEAGDDVVAFGYALDDALLWGDPRLCGVARGVGRLGEELGNAQRRFLEHLGRANAEAFGNGEGGAAFKSTLDLFEKAHGTVDAVRQEGGCGTSQRRERRNSRGGAEEIGFDVNGAVHHRGVVSELELAVGIVEDAAALCTENHAALVAEVAGEVGGVDRTCHLCEREEVVEGIEGMSQCCTLHFAPDVRARVHTGALHFRGQRLGDALSQCFCSERGAGEGRWAEATAAHSLRPEELLSECREDDGGFAVAECG